MTDTKGIEAALAVYPMNYNFQDNEAMMRAAIRAYCKAEGVVMMPREPTKEMVSAAFEYLIVHDVPVLKTEVEGAICAAFAAANGDQDE